MRTSAGLGVWWLAMVASLPAAENSPPPVPVSAATAATPKTIHFNRDIRPILADKCFTCHGPDAKQRAADLRLDTREGTLGKAGGGGVVVPGQPEESDLFLRITSQDPTEKMPPPKSGLTLTAGQIELLKRWIAAGASWQEHWSFEPLVRPQVPVVKQAAWPRNDIDRFVLSQLEERGWEPAPEASRSTLLRRVTLDLTGLPPTPAEVDAFLADPSPHAYEKVVDRLLASPRFGETLAFGWLDAARYADTNGYQRDGRRFMHFWRDWVIQAFNRNLPFDQFTIEQLAGDLLPHPTQEQKIATGFNRNHRLNGEGGAIPEESRTEYVMDRVETTGTVWLGLTLNCSRCHDHKYDPLTQIDFYRLFALFNNVPETGGLTRFGSAMPYLDLGTPAQQTVRAAAKQGLEEAKARVAAREKVLEQQRKQHSTIPGKPVAGTAAGAPPQPGSSPGTASPAGAGLSSSATPPPPSDPELERLQTAVVAARKKFDDAERVIPFAMIMEELPQPRETFLLHRGEYDKPTKIKVTAGVPSSLLIPGQSPPKNRLEFARWLVDPRNPLPSRVTINRFWQQVFGRGFVKTNEDFGTQGDRPSHPELLDWLADEFIRSGWNIKHVFKLMVTSATYRQSSRVSPPLRELDPENRLLARGPRFRMSAAALRDQALFLSGLLVEKIGGPPVKPYQPPGVWEALNLGPGSDYVQDHGENLYRRSLYIFWRRTIAPTVLFDVGQRQVCEVNCKRTNTPLQALALLNDVTYVEAARVFAQRMLREGGGSPEMQLAYGFRCATARPPAAAELRILLLRYQLLLDHYRKEPAAARQLLQVGEAPVPPQLDAAKLAAFTSIAEVLLNLDETITKG